MINSNLEETIKLQQFASNPKNSCWVFASAGSGKTSILTNRVLRLLLSDVAPNKILCLTFTNAGALEMQNRINEKLSEWILLNDDELSESIRSLTGSSVTKNDLIKARSLFIKTIDSEYKIKAQTIHSFCQNLIKIFPFESNIRPTFEILEDKQQALLIKKSQDEIFRSSDPNLQKLITAISYKVGEEDIFKLIKNILDKKESLLNLKENFGSLENVKSAIFQIVKANPEEGEEEIFQRFVSLINDEELKILAEFFSNSKTKSPKEWSENIWKFLQNKNLKNVNQFKLAFLTKEDTPRNLPKEFENDDFAISSQEKYGKICLDFEENINSHNIACDSILLLELSYEIINKYNSLKKQQGFVDYNDLISLTNQLLENPDFSDWIKMKMDSNFDHILVDESQDTNHQQWNIVKALSEDFFSGQSLSEKERSIFIVGDEKQSIYSFQGAEPTISLDIYKYFKERLLENFHKVELNNSFRSQAEILQLVDLVFADEERSKAISKATKYQNHQTIKTGKGTIEIWPKIQDDKNDDSKENFSLNFKQDSDKKASEKMAEIVAKKIRLQVDNKSPETTAEYGDFMILSRTRSNDFNKFLVKYLNKYQIPFTSSGRIKFSDSLIIQDLLAIARFSCLKEDDLNLACLLKSAFFKVSEEDLLEICNYRNLKNITIFDSLKSQEKFAKIYLELEEILEKSKHLDILEFYYFLLFEKEFYQKFIANFGYETSEVLEKFLLIIGDFKSNFSPNIQKLLEIIDKLDFEISLSSDAKNKVKISTIHSAKGLQSKIIIMPDCCYSFSSFNSAKEKVLWLKYNNSSLPIWCAKNKNRLFQEQSEIAKNLAKEEYLRLLYVALTRAEDQIYIGGFGSKLDEDCWYEIIKNCALEDNIVNEDNFYQELLQNITLDKKAELSPSKKVNYHKKRNPETVKNKEINQINNSQINGTIIHKILEFFGKNYQQDKSWLLEMTKKIAYNNSLLSKEEKDSIFDKVNNFLMSENFNHLFLSEDIINIKCEVEIGGSFDNKNSLSRIDLLIEKENEIIVIDYKSDEKTPEIIPEKYINQLKSYKKLLGKIYPNKIIATKILWLNNSLNNIVEV